MTEDTRCRLKSHGKKSNRKEVFIYKKEIINKIKRQLTAWDMMDNMFIFLMQKEHMQVNNKYSKMPIDKWTKDMNRHIKKY